MPLPTNYADGQTIHASSDDAGGGGVNGWTTAINASTNLLAGTGNATLTNPTVQGYTEKVQALGTVGATSTIGALTTGTLVTATLTSATACTFTMPTATNGMSFLMGVVQPAAGTATTATFTGVDWGTAGAPTLTATLGAMDLIAFVCINAKWRGSVSKGFTY